MGVAGSGKTTVARTLAAALGWPCFDADDFHPPENVAAMAAGRALADVERWPWLDALRAYIDALLAAGTDAVGTCSALKAAYRHRLGTGRDAVRLVYLDGDYETIRRRLAGRTGHFFDPALLRTQFDVLEVPTDALAVPIDQPPEAIVRTIREAFGLGL